jgi:hypothetical protein
MYTRLVLFSLAGFALWALGRNRPDPQARVPESSAAADVHGVYVGDVDKTRARERSSFSKRRLATSLTFATLFFAGAALSAGAGDMVAEMVEGSDAPAAAETTTAEAPAEEAPPAEAPPAPEAPAEEPAEAPAEEPAEAPADDPAEGPAEEPAAGGSEGEDAPANDAGEATEGEQPAEGEPAPGSEEPEEEQEPGPAPKDDEPPESSQPEAEHEDEAEQSHELPAQPPAEASEELEFESGFATIWLHRTLPDPTPLAKRLTPDFARRLLRTANREHADWALVLAVLRANHNLGREPATQAKLTRLSRQLAARNASRDPWSALLAMWGRTAFADRTTALMHYYHAVGLRALVTGLQAAKPALEERVMFDSRIDMYAGGADDVASGRIDVRVLVLMRYLAEAHGQVTVSSLKTGHGFFARPGVPSAHMYGLAVDISGLEGRSIMGNQQPGGLTERAVRNILLMPVELRPKQVISLLGLGGPSFPLEDHHDHIHVGY